MRHLPRSVAVAVAAWLLLPCLLLVACSEQSDATIDEAVVAAQDTAADSDRSGSPQISNQPSETDAASLKASTTAGSAGTLAIAAAEQPRIINRVYSVNKGADLDALTQAKARLTRFLDALGKLQRQVDHSQIETDSLLESLDYDAVKIRDFVRDRIAFEQYPGSLRGAHGTLVSRAGNALDQALLLATLLRDAGFDARIASGRISEAQAERLLGGIGSQGTTAASPVSVDSGDWQSQLDALQKLSGASDPADFGSIRQQPFFKITRDTSTDLIKQLRSAGLATGSGMPAQDQLLDEARDYFWVEWREGASGAWTALHPAFPTSALPDVAAVTRYHGSIPEALQQRLRVEVFIAQKLGDNLKSVRVAGPWERPTANLDGQMLSFSNQPNTLDIKAARSGIGDAVQRAMLFIPMLNGTPGLAFDLKGSTIDASALGMDQFGAAALFKTIGDKTDKAANALSAIGAKPDRATPELRALAAQWIVYTLIQPDGSQRQFTRTIMSRIGDDPERMIGKQPVVLAELDDDSQRRALTVQQRFMLATGTYSEAYVIDRTISHLIDSGAAWRGLLDFLWGKPVAIDKRTVPGLSPLPHLALYRMFDRGPSLFDAPVAYRAEPTLVVLRDGLLSDTRGFRSVDVVTNARRVLQRTADGKLAYAIDKALAIGVWETVSEALAHSNIAGGDAHRNTFEVFAAAQKQGIRTRVLGPDASVNSLSLPDSEKLHLARDQSDGFAVIVPERVPTSQPRGGWWRIDPRTGTTLGMTGDGRGSEITEYLIDVTGNALTLINSVKGYMDCEQYTDIETKACCLVEAHMRNIGGMALGGAIGASFGGAAGLMCDIGGMARADIEGALGTRNEWQCTLFNNPEGAVGPDGIVNTTAMGCGLFQDQ